MRVERDDQHNGLDHTCSRTHVEINCLPFVFAIFALDSIAAICIAPRTQGETFYTLLAFIGRIAETTYATLVVTTACHHEPERENADWPKRHIRKKALLALERRFFVAIKRNPFGYGFLPKFVGDFQKPLKVLLACPRFAFIGNGLGSG